MIQDAHLILALDAVRARANARNETLVPGLFVERTSLCDLFIDAYLENATSTLGAGGAWCLDRSTFGADIYNNIVQQIELMGMPLSNGDVGQGVRLLLGSEITLTPALLVSNASDPKNQVRARKGCAVVRTCACACI